MRHQRWTRAGGQRWLQLARLMVAEVLSINTWGKGSDTLRGIMKSKRRRLVGSPPRRTAWATVSGGFLLWRAFFFERAQERFIAPFPDLPPFKVCIGHALHVLMLTGLLVSVFWASMGGLRGGHGL